MALRDRYRLTAGLPEPLQDARPSRARAATPLQVEPSLQWPR